MTVSTAWRRINSSIVARSPMSALVKCSRPPAPGFSRSIASAWPRYRLSTPTTVCPSFSSRCTACDPMYPAAPVTRTFMASAFLEDLQEEEAKNEQHHRGDAHDMEIAVDEPRHGLAAMPEQPGDHEEPQAAPHQRGRHKRGQGHRAPALRAAVDDAAPDREHLVRMEDDRRRGPDRDRTRPLAPLRPVPPRSH